MTTASAVTLDQFLAQPDTKPASEYVNGEVIQKPMPTRAHGRIQTFLIFALIQFLSRSKLGEAITEGRCVFGPPGAERAFVPDVVFVARERLTDPDYYRVAPDFVVEILSPGQNAARFADKLRFYLLHGVRLVWVIDPGEQRIHIFTLGQDTRILGPGDMLDGGDVLPGFSLSADDIIAQM